MSRDHDGGPDGDGDARDYDAMQRDIRTSQARITETLGALERKFSRLAPRHLKEQMMERMHTNPGGRTAHSNAGPFDAGHDDSSHGGYGSRAKGGMASIGDTMRSHPVPLAMIGIGLGWLALTGSGYDRKLARSGAVRSVRGRVGDATGYARQAFSSAGEHVSDAVGSATQRVRGGGSHTGSGPTGSGQTTGMYSGGVQSSRATAVSGQRAKGMASSFWDMVEEHPLVAGVMGLTLGAALGASIPSTRYENDLIGDYADEATERAKSMAHDYVDRGTRAARAALETVQEELGDAVDTARHAATDAVQAAKEEASKPS